ncbi:magnesium transporter MRS2-10 isoform X2 [Selaginella moellendorffii]|uniref:magnesium transporter MRS2-10 isoform X2 n=1 Tax=Selaginella moellendorffii TaxID=88036 RepID=UPI000D1C6530|nr:magnesium transporter MRS2-10 isoform X2 [Selaginella moellendorffii]|eukprot:XP_024514835.1 magnesium transporter MRS2-10 isoform X2 [Selaginella moellendorffii]
MGDHLRYKLLHRAQSPTSNLPKPLFQGMDVVGLKKRGQGIRSWIRIDRAGNSQVLEMDKFSIMRRCELPARDLRLLDPLFVYPSTLLGREKAIVVNLEQIRCIITADEVLLLNSLDHYVLQYVSELQRRLMPRMTSSSSSSNIAGRYGGGGGIGAIGFGGGGGGGGGSWECGTEDHPAKQEMRRAALMRETDMFSGSSAADDLPFEFRALEVALESACTYLDTQATELEEEAYPVLDDLTSKISTLNLERVRRLKSRLVALTRRVQKVRDEIEHLMDDDGDMAEMYLTEKKERAEGFLYSNNVCASVSAPVSPVGSPPTEKIKSLDKTMSLGRNLLVQPPGSDSETERVEELEMLLEAYFVVIDGTLNKLTSLKEYIDDTEDFINIQLDNVRNQLIQFELLLTTATFVVAIFGVIAGVFGMNIQIDLFDEPRAFKWILITSGVAGIAIFLAFVLFFKQRRLLSL